MYKIETPNKLYNGVTEGVPFSKGIGQTDDKNIRNVLVNDYGYTDITDFNKLEKDAKEIGQVTEESAKEIGKSLQELFNSTGEDSVDIETLTVPQLKELAKELKLTNYSKLTKEDLIELISNSGNDNA